jgi:hypothetical protein
MCLATLSDFSVAERLAARPFLSFCFGRCLSTSGIVDVKSTGRIIDNQELSTLTTVVIKSGWRQEGGAGLQACGLQLKKTGL